MTAQEMLAGGVGIAACIDDLRRRQISNWIPGAAFLSGVVLQTVQHGWRGTGSALLGTGGRGSVPDLLLVGRHGRRRREVDGRLRRAARGETALERCFVDGRMWRGDGAGRDRLRRAWRPLGAQELLGKPSRGVYSPAGTESGQHTIRSGDRRRRLVEPGRCDMSAGTRRALRGMAVTSGHGSR